MTPSNDNNSPQREQLLEGNDRQQNNHGGYGCLFCVMLIVFSSAIGCIVALSYVSNPNAREETSFLSNKDGAIKLIFNGNESTKTAFDLINTKKTLLGLDNMGVPDNSNEYSYVISDPNGKKYNDPKIINNNPNTMFQNTGNLRGTTAKLKSAPAPSI